ncbi:MAG: DNA polymerase III subunit alpha, partial [Cyclobacteriaceae bacterium]|nr:DNA polymerase III subunit alpha [Cyclobacteriaceae bacterium HetDA_MAG_MS6]
MSYCSLLITNYLLFYSLYINCHTYFSFKYGTLSVKDLFEEARKNHIHKLILTDINNTSGYIELLRICKERRNEWDLEIGLGIEFRENDELLYIGLARNDEGFESLNGFLSHHNNTKLPLPRQAPFGLLENTYFVYPLSTAPPPSQLREVEFVGIKTQEINKIITSPYASYIHKLIALHPVTLKDKTTFNIHRLLRAIDQNVILSKLSPTQQAHPNEIMMPVADLKEYYQQYPVLIQNTCSVLEDCKITLELGKDKNKRYFKGTKKDDQEYLFTKAREGYDRKYEGRKTAITDERFEREVDIIKKKNFESYYLITYDIVNYARSQGFDYVGRGSGANSLIAYCLDVTNTDPIVLDLYFERFLNPERSSPPDFDMDFSWKDRDHIYQYIFDTYGKRHVALLGTHTTYQGKSNLRELGKVFGLPKEEIDKIIENRHTPAIDDHIINLMFQYSRLMTNIPANLSIHAGGVLITENPIYAYTATNLPPKDFPVAHIEMHNAEDIGIYKFDILSQRGLGHIKDAVELVKKNKGIEENIDRFHDFEKDPKIKNLLSEGNCMGCFYVESPAMRMLLGKLGCNDYLTLVAASSIIRPGVARSGMMRAYIERHHLKQAGKSYESIHPLMDEIMDDTYGVMVYQEDVIKVAHLFAGLTLTEADVLRRGMSGKYRSRQEFQRVKDQFFKNCKAQRYPQHVTDRVWYEIESFAGYSFSKGHSASYALESYQSLYLKAHYPLEFMVGVINNFGGFYKTEFYFHEARMWGARIQAPCINHSEYLTHIYGDDIYIGFIHLKDLQQKIGQTIALERMQNGPFKNLDNFIRRIPIGLEQIRILIRIGAFRFTGKSKKEMLWQAQLYFGQKSKKVYHLDLFEEEPFDYKLPNLEDRPLEDAFDEIELLGFPLCDPFSLVSTEDCGNTRALDLRQKINDSV